MTFSDIMRELWRADVPITESIEECHARLIARWPSLAAVIR
jgi:hypothetical protein